MQRDPFDVMLADLCDRMATFTAEAEALENVAAEHYRMGDAKAQAVAQRGAERCRAKAAALYAEIAPGILAARELVKQDGDMRLSAVQRRRVAKGKAKPNTQPQQVNGRAMREGRVRVRAR